MLKLVTLILAGISIFAAIWGLKIIQQGQWFLGFSTLLIALTILVTMATADRRRKNHTDNQRQENNKIRISCLKQEFVSNPLYRISTHTSPENNVLNLMNVGLETPQCGFIAWSEVQSIHMTELPPWKEHPSEPKYTLTFTTGNQAISLGLNRSFNEQPEVYENMAKWLLHKHRQLHQNV